MCAFQDPCEKEVNATAGTSDWTPIPGAVASGAEEATALGPYLSQYLNKCQYNSSPLLLCILLSRARFQQYFTNLRAAITP